MIVYVLAQVLGK